MAIVSIKTLLDKNNLATPRQFDDWNKAWRVALEGGSQETLLSFIAREKGNTEDVFLQELAKALGWPYVELSKTEVSPEARKKISTKVAFQYFVLPITLENGQLQVVVSNPFDAAMLGAVQFDARVPVSFALTPRAEIEKSLKKFYGVGAETLDEISKEDDDLDVLAEDKEITEDNQEASVIRFVNQIIWEAYKDRS